MLHIFVIKPHFFISEREIRSNLVTVKSMTSFLANHSRGSLKRLMVCSINFFGRRLSSLYDSGEEAHPDLGSIRYLKHAFSLGPLLELLLTDSFGQLKKSTLSCVYVKDTVGKLIFIERDDVCIKGCNFE